MAMIVVAALALFGTSASWQGAGHRQPAAPDSACTV
jgi:hypothetical protein